MNQPESVRLKLTDEQVRQLTDLYVYAAAENAKGRPGMILAQVGDIRHGGHGFIQVGFFRHEVAKQWTREAGFNEPQSHE